MKTEEEINREALKLIRLAAGLPASGGIAVELSACALGWTIDAAGCEAAPSEIFGALLAKDATGGKVIPLGPRHENEKPGESDLC